MLMLARKYGERIVIPTSEGNIEITLFPKKHSSTVRVGVKAPQEVSIVRGEIWDHCPGEFAVPLVSDERYH